MNAHARPAIQGDANVEDYDVKQDRYEIAHGTSEQYLGTSLKNLGIKREDVVIAS